MTTIIEAIVPRVLPKTKLIPAERAAMYSLLEAHFSGVTNEQFTSDLSEKSHVILLEREKRLVGFSTLLAYETSFAGKPISVIYSGDTIVAPEAWRSPVLSRAWITTVNGLRRDFPRGGYYWLLLTSGFRTYRFLPVFWRDFFPAHCRPTPSEKQQLIDHIARERFGSAYDDQSGIVRFARPQRLNPKLAAVPSGRILDPHVNFFLQRNPAHANGDELVCLTDLDASNLTRAGRRMVDRPTP